MSGGQPLWYQTGIFLPLGEQIVVATDGAILRTEFLKYHTTACMIDPPDAVARAHHTLCPWTNESRYKINQQPFSHIHSNAPVLTL